MKTHCRCRKCQTRKALPRHPSEYVIQPKCQCGERNWRQDQWMTKRNVTAMTCYSDCMPFYHRMGSKGCKHDLRPPELPEGLWEEGGKLMATCRSCENPYEYPGDRADGFDQSMSYCGGSQWCLP